MVSKVAVIAIVVIVAAPILLGYAMAFEEVFSSVIPINVLISVGNAIAAALFRTNSSGTSFFWHLTISRFNNRTALLTAAV